MELSFPSELPISAHVDELAAAIAKNSVVVVAGETGSGKTTQLPKICLHLGRERIGCTQPRRIAATSVAERVAHETQTPLGELVGYKIRFADKLSRTARVKFMTDGILLAEVQSDPLLRAYDTIIIDEAHERSLNIDFLLGYLKRLIPRRPDLRVIASSATLELERFAAFFDGAPIVSVSGRTYPVDVLYRPPTDDEQDISDVVANAVTEVTELDPHGDILVFLPGEREIRESLAELEQRALPHTTLLPLYGRLSAADQQRVFQRTTGRRVVLATNVAETSLTIPGIRYVVDTGLARINRYDPRTGVSQLLVEPVSRASADQRKGRCGRTEHGVCFRLYDEADYESRPAYTDPEIKRVSLAGVVLRMKTLRLGDLEDFPLLDPPRANAVRDGYRVLEELGALDDTGELTEIGRQLGRLPLDPRLGRMILGGRDENALREVVVIASALGLRDPRDRPREVAQRADEAHAQFRDDGSDFAGYLKLWELWRRAKADKSRRQLHKLCRDTFLNYNRMREWDDVHDQIVRVMKELDLAPNAKPASGEQIHRALLPGLLSKIGMYNKETRSYTGARQLRFVIHPSSGLAKKPAPWVMAAELVETSQLFARTVARIDPAWLERAGGELCKRSYGDVHWDDKRAAAVAREHVTLFGLPVASRVVSYAAIDPVRSRELVIVHALVRGEQASKSPVIAHNARVQADAQRLRDKARKSDMFADETDLVAWFDGRVPATIVDGKSLDAWLATGKNAKQLELAVADVLLDDARDLTPERFPDKLGDLPLVYRFDPGEDDDGVTVTVPLAMLPQLDAAMLSWPIPGWRERKIVALLESLPRAVRKQLATFATLDDLARELAGELTFRGDALVPTLERAIHAKTGERVARSAWDVRAVPQYLDFMVRVVDDRGKVLASGRDVGELQVVLGQRARDAWAAAPREVHERTGLREMVSLPESVEVVVAGARARAYPALADREHSVDLVLLESRDAARVATRDGLRRLALFATAQSYGKLDALLPTGFDKELRRTLVARALDEAFGFADTAAKPAELPRDAAAFGARIAAGRDRLVPFVRELGRHAQLHAGELAKVRAALKPLVGKPGLAKAVVDDVDSQLAHLAPAWATVSGARLEHLLRYLKALQVRLQRQAHDPVKDQGKAAQVAPLWAAYVAKRPALIANGCPAGELDELAWLVEELRVQVFAPELKTVVPVSPQRVQDLWASLQR
nr:ATP-dependent RNA helicase HrpA [Kofleriaceae bacterium]